MLIYSSTHLRWLLYCTSALFGDVVMFSGEIRKRCSFILMNAVCCWMWTLQAIWMKSVSVLLRARVCVWDSWDVMRMFEQSFLHGLMMFCGRFDHWWRLLLHVERNEMGCLLFWIRAFVKLRFEQLIKYRTILKSFSKSCVFYCSFSDTPCALQLLKSVFDKSRLN